MKLLRNEKVIDIMEKTMNHVDERLLDHGKRVAYLMFKVLEHQNMFDRRQLRDICVLAMLHDVGAYKTEEIDKMIIFETIDVWEHSIYGYLFLKYFSPLKKLAPVLLFHHAECGEIPRLDPERRLLAQLISLCDRADVYLHYGDNARGFRDHLEKYRGVKYDSEAVDLFLTSGVDISRVYENIDADAAFRRVFRDTPLTEKEVDGYIEMIIFSIDFRSSQTVIHTVATTCVAEMIAALTGADAETVKAVKTGAMLHDIGKIGIPVHILESADRLSEDDMKIMRTHVDITEKILDGNVEEVIKRIAVKHHERPNGSGYPNNLDAADLSYYEQAVSVADTFSALCGARSYKEAYPKERVIGILEDLSEREELNPEIVALVIRHYDEILEAVERESQPVLLVYEALDEERRRIRDAVIRRDFESVRC